MGALIPHVPWLRYLGSHPGETAQVPRRLRFAPFVGRDAIAEGLLTKRQLSGDAWRRLLPGIYAWRELNLSHHDRCIAVGLFLDGRGAVSGRDAATLLGADVLVRGAPVEVTLDHVGRLKDLYGS